MLFNALRYAYSKGSADSWRIARQKKKGLSLSWLCRPSADTPLSHFWFSLKQKNAAFKHKYCRLSRLHPACLLNKRWNTKRKSSTSEFFRAPQNGNRRTREHAVRLRAPSSPAALRVSHRSLIRAAISFETIREPAASESRKESLGWDASRASGTRAAPCRRRSSWQVVCEVSRVCRDPGLASASRPRASYLVQLG